jgi:hypothetical protein
MPQIANITVKILTKYFPDTYRKSTIRRADYCRRLRRDL